MLSLKTSWGIKTIPEIFDILHSRELGLTKEEVVERFRKYGPNKLPEAKADNIAIVFFRQFQSSLIFLLLLATAIVFLTGENIDGFVILFVLFFVFASYLGVHFSKFRGKRKIFLGIFVKFVADSDNWP